MKLIFMRLIAVFIAVSSIAFPTIVVGQPTASETIAQLSGNAKLHAPDTALAPLAEAGGTGNFIVLLKQPRAASASLFATEAGKAEARASVQATLDAFFNRRQAADLGTVTRTFSYMPGFAVTLTAQQLADLLASDEVASVEEDGVLEPHLRQGIPLENALATRAQYNGSGVAVAICDTGIDYTNPYLGNGGFPNAKVIGGYDTGENKADPLDRHGHGTACAGIVAGTVGDSGDYIGGVAYNAKLYALKISTTATGGSASNASMIAAWEWAVTHQNDAPATPIRIISTSFGGSRYTSSCDSAVPAMTTAAANAVAAGITIFASSGNDGYCDSMGWPACITHVVSVGAVYDANFGTYYPCVSADSCAAKTAGGCSSGYYATDNTVANMVTSYSNSASFLTLFAPSNKAYTLQCSYQGSTFNDSFGGTSAACPYAAGAATALQSAAKAITGSFLTPAQVRSTLTATGVSTTDGKVAVTKPRVNLQAAINTLSPPTSAGGANLLPLGIPAAVGGGNSSSATGFTEQFNTNLANWTGNSYGQWSIVSGAATTTGTSSAKYRYLNRSGATYADLDYRVVMRRATSQNSSNCLYFRAAPTPEDSYGDIDSGYWFGYSNAGQFTVWKATAGGNWSALQGWTGTAAINVNGTNELRAVASGSTLTFYINATQVFTTTDTSLTSGQVGFGMYDGDGGVLSVDSASLAGTAADAAITVPATVKTGTPPNADAKKQSP